MINSLEVPLNSYSSIVEGQYVETVWFTDSDNGILKEIYLSKDNEPINIKLIGEGTHSYTIPEKIISKIKDAYEFAGLLKKVKLSAKEKKETILKR